MAKGLYIFKIEFHRHFLNRRIGIFQHAFGFQQTTFQRITSLLIFLFKMESPDNRIGYQDFLFWL